MTRLARLLLLSSCVLAGAANAATFTVNLTTDAVDLTPGDGLCDSSATAGVQCTLRAAIMEANALAGADIVNLTPGTTYTLTLPTTDGGWDDGRSGDLDVTGDLTLQTSGNGAMATINGNGIDRVLHVDPANGVTPVKVTVQSVIIRGGRLGSAHLGGGISSAGDLTLIGVQVTDNVVVSGSTNQRGGGVYSGDNDLTLVDAGIVSNDLATSGNGPGIYVTGSATGATNRLTITNSTIAGHHSRRYGGGLGIDVGQVTISGSTFSGNSAAFVGGALFGPAAGAITISGTLFTGNVAGDGSDVWATDYSGGAIAFDGAPLMLISDSTFTGNSARQANVNGYGATGGALSLGWGARGAITIRNTTFTNNTADTNGGAINQPGGATTAIDIVNSTFSGNTAMNGGGALFSDHPNGPPLRIISSTIVNNAACQANIWGGGGVYVAAGSPVIRNSIIADNYCGNIADLDDVNCQSGGITSEGYNFLEAVLCTVSGSTTGNRNGPTPLLAPLASYGGPTLTHASRWGSQVIETGNPAGCTDVDGGLLLSDQRGGPRTDADGDGTARCDIGAYEFGGLGLAAFTSLNPSGSEATGVAQVSVSRLGNLAGPVSLLISTAPTGTATSGVDYLPDSGTLSWANGVGGPLLFPVTIINDTAIDWDETFEVRLSNPSATLDLRAPLDAGVLISDDDYGGPGVLAFSTFQYNVTEGMANATVTVTRVGGAGGPVSVSYATSDWTAHAADYVPASGSLSWASGDSSAKTFQVAILDDSTFEPPESVYLNLSSPMGGATIGSGGGTATLLINDNDVSSQGTVGFSSNAFTVAENGATATITAERTGGLNGDVYISFATSNGTATAGADYSSASGTLTWYDGQQGPKTFTVPLIDDTIFEGDETVLLSLSNPLGGPALGTTAATLTIVENDSMLPGTLGFSASNASVAEAGGTVQVTVARTGGQNGAVSVQFATANGSAMAGSDYVTNSGTLSWANGDTAPKTIDVSVTNDAVLEGNESFTVTLSNPTGGAAVGTTSGSVTVAIIDDETPNPGVVSFAITSASVAETAGTLTLQVQRTGGSDGSVHVWWQAASGTATSGADFSGASNVLMWDPGDSTPKSFSVTIVDDALVEGPEQFTVTLANPTGGLVVGGNSTFTTTILDDEMAPVDAGTGGGTGGSAGGGTGGSAGGGTGGSAGGGTGGSAGGGTGGSAGGGTGGSAGGGTGGSAGGGTGGSAGGGTGGSAGGGTGGSAGGGTGGSAGGGTGSEVGGGAGGGGASSPGGCGCQGAGDLSGGLLLLALAATRRVRRRQA